MCRFFLRQKAQWYYDKDFSKGALDLVQIYLPWQITAIVKINKLTFGKCSEILGKEKVKMPIIVIFKLNVLHGMMDIS